MSRLLRYQWMGKFDMDISKLSAKAIESLLDTEADTAAILDACARDSRKNVQAISRRFLRMAQEKSRVMSLYHYEDEAMKSGATCIAGVDEAGRGPLAGPVAVGAVILPSHSYIAHINDSKKLSPHMRDLLFDEIKEKTVAYHVALIDAETIDEINIYEATKKGMREAIAALSPQPDRVLIDAVPLDLPMESVPIVKGDAKSASIAAASILAKVTRDRLMKEYDSKYPGYFFADNKGYGTKEHMEALRRLGPCPIHRRTFEPIKSMIYGRKL